MVHLPPPSLLHHFSQKLFQPLTFPPFCAFSILQAFLHWWWLCLWVSQKLRDTALSTSKSTLSLTCLGRLFSLHLFWKALLLAQALIFFLPLFSSCWLSLEGGLLYSFVGPAAAVVLVRILTLTSQSITIYCLFVNALPIITLSNPCFFLLLANRWIWSLVFWSSTSWYPRTASPMWSWRREPGRSYWSSPYTRVLRLSPSSVPLQVYWWCALISSLTIKQQEWIELRQQRRSIAAHVSLLCLMCCFLTLQGITVELLRGSAPLGPHLDVSRPGHHRPPLRPLPDPLCRLRLSGGFHHRHGSLHPA